MQAQHLDMMLYQVDGELRLAGFEFGRFEPVFGARVFQGSTKINSNFPGGAWLNSPGWTAIPTAQLDRLPTGAGPLPAEASVSFDILPSVITGVNLSFWDGAEPISFAPPPAGEVAIYGDELFGLDTVDDPSDSVIDGSTLPIDGLEFATTTGTGYLHVHVPFSIFGNSARQFTSVDSPTPGVYLLQIAGKVEGLVGKPSANVLLGVDVDQSTLEIASQWVSAQIIPEPPTLALAVVFLTWYATCRR
ncbi:MAG: hypothetical protein AAGD11_01030 [Planctomycetota bacterium]